MSAVSAARVVRAPRGPELTCRGWGQEAALRMLMNNLDPEVAERPDDLVVYGGTGKAARTWERLRRDRARAADARRRRDAAGAVRQAGRRPCAPTRRAARADRQLQPRRPPGRPGTSSAELEAHGPDDVRPDDRRLAGSTSARRAFCRAPTRRSRRCAASTSAARCRGALVLTAGLGGMGGAQPLAVDHERRRLPWCIEVDPHPHRAAPGDPLPRPMSPTTSTRRCVGSRKRRSDGKPLSDRACSATPPKSARAGRAAASCPTCVTDQTSAHDPLNGYVPPGLIAGEAAELRASRPGGIRPARARRRWPTTSARCSRCRRRAPITFDYGNNIRAQADERGVSERLRLPRLRARLHPPAVLRRQGPVPLGRALRRSRRHLRAPTRRCSSSSPKRALHRWIRLAQRARRRSRACRRASAGWATASAPRPGSRFNELVAQGEVKAPIVIGRDHLDCGSVASPNRETEAMKDGSDAIADWPILNALVNAAGGATWVSFHHGGGVGIGYSLHAGHGRSWPTARRRAAHALERVLTTDPGWASCATPTRATRARSRSPANAASTSRCCAP